MPNQEIKGRIAHSHLFQYQVAAKLGVSECTLIRWLRSELSEDKRRKVLEAIDELTKEAS